MDCAVWFLIALTAPSQAGNSPAVHRMEPLGRGVVAVPRVDGSILLTWRLLGTDAPEQAFHVSRRESDGSTRRLNPEPLAGPTQWLDSSPPTDGDVTYVVEPTGDSSIDDPQHSTYTLESSRRQLPYLSVPLRTLPGYSPNDASVGDLDGDGEYEIVLHQIGRGRDNSQPGYTTEPLLEAYRLNGTFLWRINLGRNIREGAHYTQFLVYDLDGDRRAELVCKTSDGTVDGTGQPIGDAAVDHRGHSGRTLGKILQGPEYLTVFDGLSGRALATTDFVPPRGDVGAWGDDYGNRCDRFLACVAYLDGQRPSIVWCRGYYARTVLTAWNWRDGKLSQMWTFDSDDGTPSHRAYRGQGNHSISVADVDGDGRDEIVHGSCVIDDDGRGLYSTGLGHGDALHVTDIDPDQPGLEVFKANGDAANPAGIQLRDARTGEQLFGVPCPGREGVGRACALDIDPRFPGLELWGRGQGVGGLYSARGERIAANGPRTCNMGVWWDGDLLRELLDGVRITKWDWISEQENLLLDGREFGCAANNGSKSNPCLCADILGDWREEIVARSRDGQELCIFSTPHPTDHRRITLMHDRLYRLGVAWQNVGYNQPAHPSRTLAVGR
jgi:rhamnogalacturonan endolyase